jgi:hypothetical protein
LLAGKAAQFGVDSGSPTIQVDRRDEGDGITGKSTRSDGERSLSIDRRDEHLGFTSPISVLVLEYCAAVAFSDPTDRLDGMHESHS